MKKILICLVTALLFFTLSVTDAFRKTNNTLSDNIFQSQRAIDGNIVIIGIDDLTLEKYDVNDTWKRQAIAQLLTILNSGDDIPTAIGIDILFSGNMDNSIDNALVEAAKLQNNVYFASSANFTSKMINDNGKVYNDEYYVSSFTKPYNALYEASNIGHINAMTDVDGILRTAMLYVELNDDTLIESMPLALAKKYAELNDLELKMPKTNSRHQYTISYNQTPGGYYENINLLDVLEGNVDKTYFEDKIVFVGPYSVGLQDSYYTPIDHGEMMYGVEIMANVTDSILNHRYMHYGNELIQSILILIITFGSLYLFLMRKQIISIIAYAVEFGLFVLVAKLLSDNGVMIDIIYFPLAITITFIASIILNISFATLEKMAVTNTFKKYVAPEIVHELLKSTDSLELGGKEVEIAVLFVDIRGFTTMSEALEPKRVVEILNKYLTLTSSCIMNNNGTLDKFVGDATMAFWNAPLSQDDYVFKAVKCALDMVDESKELSVELEKEFGRTVSFGIGVHIGKAVVGNIGAVNRMDYTAIGDTVNTSARLEANAKGGQILISREVANALEGRITYNSLGDSIKLKGKKDGFEVLELLDIKKDL